MLVQVTSLGMICTTQCTEIVHQVLYNNCMPRFETLVNTDIMSGIMRPQNNSLGENFLYSLYRTLEGNIITTFSLTWTENGGTSSGYDSTDRVNIKDILKSGWWVGLIVTENATDNSPVREGVYYFIT